MKYITHGKFFAMESGVVNTQTMKPGFFLTTVALTFLSACNNPSTSPSSGTDTMTSTSDSARKETARAPSLKEQDVTYTANGVTMDGYVVYDTNKEGKRPAVLVVPEWWGLVDYPKMRARKLAELGYIAMAIDMFGNGKIAETPGDAMKATGPFYNDLKMTKSRFDAALAKLKTFSQADTSNIAAIGYCFGGGVVLNVARLGDDLKGVVSFHGSLIGAPAKKDLLKAKILVCHGMADSLVKPDQVVKFKKQMDSIGADYTFKQYPNATHAFTNPASDANGEKFKMPVKYNAEADAASWNDMKDFFARIFK
ncbi:MAG TPA: dienelactone hydrolase family protein [Chitinophagaceae bacterium]|jgi:dienelactone hydrolase|nr:dienelactone hydrolase family protein [Chitinophagaceae bacterium]